MPAPRHCPTEPMLALTDGQDVDDGCHFTDTDDSDVDRYDSELQFSFLQRAWLSKRFGYIHVLQDPSNPNQLNVLQPSFHMDLARVFRLGERTWELTALGKDGSFLERWKFDGWQGTKRRMLWTECNSGDHEVWDGRLLAAIGRAAKWVDQRGLASQFGHGLQRLSMNETTGSEVSVGLCTSTRNRLWQLKRALPLNILHVWPHRRWVKLHVVVCSSTDSTLRFLVEQCRFAIDIGLLEVYTTEDRMPYWHASVGRNTAHMVSKEHIVVNVDGDNLVGPDFPVDVMRHMFEGFTALHYEEGEGTGGRIACLREDFCRIKGYDEDCMPIGGQGFDLLRRLKRLPGAQIKSIQGNACGQAIPNTKLQKVAACDPKYADLKWTQMGAFNSDLLYRRRAAGQTKRNTNKLQIGVRAMKADLAQDHPGGRIATRPRARPSKSTSSGSEQADGHGQEFEDVQDLDGYGWYQHWLECYRSSADGHGQEFEDVQDLDGYGWYQHWLECNQSSADGQRLASEQGRSTDRNQMHWEHTREQRSETHRAGTIGELDGTWIDIDRPQDQYVIENHRVKRMTAAGTRKFSICWNSDWECWQLGRSRRSYMQWLSKDEILWLRDPSKKDGPNWCWQRRAPAACPNTREAQAATQTRESIGNDRALEPAGKQDQTPQIGQALDSDCWKHAGDRSPELESPDVNDGTGNEHPPEEVERQEEACAGNRGGDLEHAGEHMQSRVFASI